MNNINNAFIYGRISTKSQNNDINGNISTNNSTHFFYIKNKTVYTHFKGNTICLIIT